MPTLRRTGRDGSPAARPGRPEILLSSESPYGSRRLVVEYDGSTTTAYLYGQSAAIAAVWIANHVPAPRAADPRTGRSGEAERQGLPSGLDHHGLTRLLADEAVEDRH